MRLRHLAFAEILAGSTPPSGAWPPSPPDLFEGVEGAPEVSRAELSAATLGSAIMNHGCLLVRGLVPPAWCDRLGAAIDQAFDACDAFMAGATADETSPWYVPFEPEPAPGMSNPAWGTALIVTMIVALLGAAAVGPLFAKAGFGLAAGGGVLLGAIAVACLATDHHMGNWWLLELGSAAVLTGLAAVGLAQRLRR